MLWVSLQISFGMIFRVIAICLKCKENSEWLGLGFPQSYCGFNFELSHVCLSHAEGPMAQHLFLE